VSNQRSTLNRDVGLIDKFSNIWSGVKATWGFPAAATAAVINSLISSMSFAFFLGFGEEEEAAGETTSGWFTTFSPLSVS